MVFHRLEDLSCEAKVCHSAGINHSNSECLTFSSKLSSGSANFDYVNTRRVQSWIINVDRVSSCFGIESKGIAKICALCGTTVSGASVVDWASLWVSFEAWNNAEDVLIVSPLDVQNFFSDEIRDDVAADKDLDDGLISEDCVNERIVRISVLGSQLQRNGVCLHHSADREALIDGTHSQSGVTQVLNFLSVITHLDLVQ